jgi:hypothetical protein
MEVHFPPDIDEKLTHFAAEQGRNPNEVGTRTVTHYFEEETRFVEVVTHVEEALRRGAP